MIRRWLLSQDALIGAVAVLGVVVYVAVSAAMHRVGFPLDDSWIHQTYARNLAEDGEWAFVPGEPSAASTSPLYSLLLSLGYGLHIPFFAWTFALGALALAGAGWIGARAGQILFPSLPQIGLWTGMAMVVAWHLVWSAVSGMETMLFCTLSLAVVWLVWRELTIDRTADRLSYAARRGLWVGLVGAGLTLTRPEGAGLVGLAGLMILVAWPFGSVRHSWLLCLAWGSGLVVGWLVGVLPYIALNYHLNETLLPSTAAAKQAENAPVLEFSLLERYRLMLKPLAAGGQLLLIPGIGVALYRVLRHAQRPQWLFLLPLLWAAVDLSAYALRLPAPYQHGRYVIPVLPHLILYGIGGTLSLVWASRHSVQGRVLSRSLALSVAAIMLVFWVIGAQVYARDVRIINTEMVDTAHWVKENLPTDELLAVHDIGAVGYYAPRPILDLAGLVSPEVVPIILDHEALMQLMCRRDTRYLMVLPTQLPAKEDDPRLGAAPIFVTNAPYAPAAGSGNMAVYELHWPDDCSSRPE